MAADIIIGVLVLAGMMSLAWRYTRSDASLHGQRSLLFLLVFCWFAYALLRLSIGARLGIEVADEIVHQETAQEIADSIESGRIKAVLGDIGFGNKAFAGLLALVQMTGYERHAPVLINVFFAFWGSLLLLDALSTSIGIRGRMPLPLFAVAFAPSTIFWSTSILKEALMYFAMCLMVSALTVPAGRLKPRVGRLWAAALIGGMLRPHMMVIGAVAFAIATVFRKGSRLQGVFAVLIAVGCLLALQTLRSFDLNSASIGEQLEENQEKMVEVGSAGSAIGGSILGVSGAINMFLRPFPWDSRSSADLLSGVEIFGIDALLVFGWWYAHRDGRAVAKSQPVALFVFMLCCGFCVWFTWIGNEGLLVRTRVQAFPCLLSLIALPWLSRIALDEEAEDEAYEQDEDDQEEAHDDDDEHGDDDDEDHDDDEDYEDEPHDGYHFADRGTGTG